MQMHCLRLLPFCPKFRGWLTTVETLAAVVGAASAAIGDSVLWERLQPRWGLDLPLLQSRLKALPQGPQDGGQSRNCRRGGASRARLNSACAKAVQP